MSRIMKSHTKHPAGRLCRALLVTMAAAMVFARIDGPAAQSPADTDKLVTCMVENTTDWDRDQLYPVFFADKPTEAQTNTVGLIVIQKMLDCGMTARDLQGDLDYFVEVSELYGMQLAFEWLKSANK